MSVVISFVIPALNEEENIGATLDSIESYCQHPHQVVVVDHGSADSTRDIASAKGAMVLRHVGGTIGGLRNLGVSKALGAVVVFIDADVLLTESWKNHINETVERVLAGEKLVTGSHCSPPSGNNWLHRFWFSGLATDPRNTHLGTGHMIVSRQGFLDLHGFDPALKTGEDYEFCVRAVDSGYRIENQRALVVLHKDFPSNLLSFMRRECWHGRSDFESFSAFLKSKVAIATAVFLLLHGLLLFGMTMEMGALGLLLTLFFSSLTKYQHMGVLAISINAFIFYFYFWGRSCALLRGLLRFRQG